jgi:hypothetical protein
MDATDEDLHCLRIELIDPGQAEAMLRRRSDRQSASEYSDAVLPKYSRQRSPCKCGLLKGPKGFAIPGSACAVGAIPVASEVQRWNGKWTD